MDNFRLNSDDQEIHKELQGKFAIRLEEYLLDNFWIDENQLKQIDKSDPIILRDTIIEHSNISKLDDLQRKKAQLELEIENVRNEIQKDIKKIEEINSIITKNGEDMDKFVSLVFNKLSGKENFDYSNIDDFLKKWHKSTIPQIEKLVKQINLKKEENKDKNKNFKKDIKQFQSKIDRNTWILNRTEKRLELKKTQIAEIDTNVESQSKVAESIAELFANNENLIELETKYNVDNNYQTQINNIKSALLNEFLSDRIELIKGKFLEEKKEVQDWLNAWKEMFDDLDIEELNTFWIALEALQDANNASENDIDNMAREAFENAKNRANSVIRKYWYDEIYRWWNTKIKFHRHNQNQYNLQKEKDAQKENNQDEKLIETPIELIKDLANIDIMWDYMQFYQEVTSTIFAHQNSILKEKKSEIPSNEDVSLISKLYKNSNIWSNATVEDLLTETFKNNKNKNKFISTLSTLVACKHNGLDFFIYETWDDAEEYLLVKLDNKTKNNIGRLYSTSNVDEAKSIMNSTTQWKLLLRSKINIPNLKYTSISLKQFNQIRYYLTRDIDKLPEEIKEFWTNTNRIFWLMLNDINNYSSIEDLISDYHEDLLQRTEDAIQFVNTNMSSRNFEKNHFNYRTINTAIIYLQILIESAIKVHKKDVFDTDIQKIQSNVNDIILSWIIAQNSSLITENAPNTHNLLLSSLAVSENCKDISKEKNSMVMSNSHKVLDKLYSIQHLDNLVRQSIILNDDDDNDLWEVLWNEFFNDFNLRQIRLNKDQIIIWPDNEQIDQHFSFQFVPFWDDSQEYLWYIVLHKISQKSKKHYEWQMKLAARRIWSKLSNSLLQQWKIWWKFSSMYKVKEWIPQYLHSSWLWNILVKKNWDISLTTEDISSAMIEDFFGTKVDKYTYVNYLNVLRAYLFAYLAKLWDKTLKIWDNFEPWFMKDKMLDTDIPNNFITTRYDPTISYLWNKSNKPSLEEAWNYWKQRAHCRLLKVNYVSPKMFNWAKDEWVPLRCVFYPKWDFSQREQEAIWIKPEDMIQINNVNDNLKKYLWNDQNVSSIKIDSDNNIVDFEDFRYVMETLRKRHKDDYYVCFTTVANAILKEDENTKLSAVDFLKNPNVHELYLKLKTKKWIDQSWDLENK